VEVGATAVPGSLRLGGRSAQDAATNARKTSGGMICGPSPTNACDGAAPVRSKKKPA